MDLSQQFMLVASREGATCAEPVFACVPAYSDLANSLDLAATFAKGVDVLGAACGAASITGAKRTRITLGKPAWGVANVHGLDTLCFWDGRTVWAKGRRGATRLRPSHVLIAWSVD